MKRGDQPIDALPAGFKGHGYLDTTTLGFTEPAANSEAQLVYSDGSSNKLDKLASAKVLPLQYVDSISRKIVGTTLEASSELAWGVKFGIKKVIFASSETVYGFCFSHGTPVPKSLPITEEDPTNPMDSYAMSKVVNEETAKAFQRRSGIDIYGLRIGNVIEPEETFLFGEFSKKPEVRLPNIFNYIDARDLGQAVDLCIAKDGLGYEVFNVSNDNNSVDLNNEQILKRFYPNSKLKFEIGSTECLFSNRKLIEKLDFKPQNNWVK